MKDEVNQTKFVTLSGNKDYLTKKIDNMEKALMKNKNAKKYIYRINNSEIIRDIKGIKINVIDPGGAPIKDAEGNIYGKTEPLLEMFYSKN